MSRIGKNPVVVPSGVKVNIADRNVALEGPKGKLAISIPFGITVEQKAEELVVARTSDLKQNRANHGTVRATLAHMVEGITNGHKKELELQGIGYRAQLQGKKIVFSLGLSHPVEFDVADDVTVTVPNQTSIIIEGTDKIRVGEVAAKIRAIKPAEPYKGKGFRYAGEIIRRKQGKSVTK